MIGLSDHWSSLVTRLLMAAPLMLYGCLFIWRLGGPYARPLNEWVCGLKVRQLYDEPVILVIVSCPLIPLSYLWTMIGTMIVYIPYDEDSLMPFMLHWMHFISHVWLWPRVAHSLVGRANEVFLIFPCEFHVFTYKTSHLPFWPFVFSKFLSFFSAFSSEFLPIFSSFMFDYTAVRLDSPSVSFLFARLGVFLEFPSGHCPQVGRFVP